MAKHKRRDGKTTTPKGGRPVNLLERRQKQAEVVRLRGQGLSYDAIASRLGMSHDSARLAYDDFWAREMGSVQATAEEIRKKETARLQHIADVNYNLATNPNIKVTKDDPDGGTMDLADFEKVTKASANFIKAVGEIAKYNGCYRPQEVAVSGGLSVSQLARILEASEAAEGK